MVAGNRSVGDGVAIDGGYQHISEAPACTNDPDGETVKVVDDTEVGEETTENVPVPDGGERPETTGQTTLDDWGWSA